MKVIKHKHQITDKQLTYLKSRCKRLEALINHIGEVESYYIKDHFTALLNGIVYQSISFKAATVIWNRFIGLFDEITPHTVLTTPRENFIDVGLSNSKADYIHNIAKAFIDNEININFESMSNEEVINELTKIKGIGPWTAEIFLIFCLYRKDIISYGDIAIRKGIEHLYNLDDKLTREQFEYYDKLYQPYQTIASFYLWEITLRKLFTTKI